MSVLVPAYNAEATIARALASARRQTHSELEIIVIDDASTDATAACVAAIAAVDPRIRLLSMALNGGPGRARNAGIEAATGEWMALLDADDAWQPQRLEAMLPLAATQQADVVFDNLAGFDAVAGDLTPPLFSRLPPAIDLAAMLDRPAGGDYDFGYLKPLVRISAVQRAGLRYEESLRISEDLLFYLELLVRRIPAVATSAAYYIYTTPQGAHSRASSPHSHTAPADRRVASALRQFSRIHAHALTPREREALAARIARLDAIAPISDFHYARRKRQRLRMLTLMATSAPVQREVITTILRKMHRRLRG